MARFKILAKNCQGTKFPLCLDFRRYFLMKRREMVGGKKGEKEAGVYKVGRLFISPFISPLS